MVAIKNLLSVFVLNVEHAHLSAYVKIIKNKVKIVFFLRN